MRWLVASEEDSVVEILSISTVLFLRWQRLPKCVTNLVVRCTHPGVAVQTCMLGTQESTVSYGLGHEPGLVYRR